MIILTFGGYMEEIKPIDHLGICKNFNDIWEYVVLGNSRYFLNRFQRIYEIKRKEQLSALKEEYNKHKEDSKERENLEIIIERLNKLPFNKGNIFIKFHNNNEPFVQIESNVRNRKVDLVYSFGSNTPSVEKDILETICDAAVRAGAEQINLYAPFIPYQREDKKDKGRVAIAAKAFLKSIQNHCGNKLGRIVTFDLHSGQAQGFIDRPVDNLYASTIFARYIKSIQFKERFGIEYNKDDFIAVSPDAGSNKRTKDFAGLLGCGSVTIEKEQREEHGFAEIDKTNYEYLRKKVYGKNVLVIDDIFDTVGTYLENYYYLKELGAKLIIGCGTHGINSPSPMKNKDGTKTKKKYPAEYKLREAGAQIVITDTITSNNMKPRIKNYYKKNKDIIVPLTITPFYAKVMMTNRLGLNASVSRIIEMEKELVRTRSNINMCRYMI